MVAVFYSYASEDRLLQERLDKHLTILKALSLITTWHRREVSAGNEWASKIDNNLNNAQIILLLVSADFLASSYCYSVEMMKAMQRHEVGDACVIPIILRPVDWKGAPFDKLQVLPSNAKPVTSWRQRDEAFFDIAKGIRRVITERFTMHTGFVPFLALHPLKMYMNHVFSSSTAYDKEITRLCNMALFNTDIERSTKEVRSLYKRARKTLKNSFPVSSLYSLLATSLERQGNYDEALAAYEQSIALDSSIAEAYYGKAKVQTVLGRYYDALITYKQAIELDPTNPFGYLSYCLVLRTCERNKEAEKAYETSISLQPHIIDMYEDWEYALHVSPSDNAP